MIYLATPYSKYVGGLNLAHMHACRIVARLIKEGMAVYSPIAFTHPVAAYGGIDPLDHDIWLAFDENMMELCDECLVAKMPGWEVSKGVQHEIAWFSLRGKPVRFYEPLPEDMPMEVFPVA